MKEHRWVPDAPETVVRLTLITEGADKLTAEQGRRFVEGLRQIAETLENADWTSGEVQPKYEMTLEFANGHHEWR